MVEIERPEFVPDPSLERDAMEALQRELAAEARWGDDLDFDPSSVVDRPPFRDGDGSVQTDLADAAERYGDDDRDGDGRVAGGSSAEQPVLAGVDQAFTDEAAVSAVVATRGGEVIERATATAPLEIPYIPGLLSFREGGAILAALAELDVEPDLLMCDGSGRIHYRQAGLATHVGVTCELPAIGVAKSLLCGEPTDDVEGLATGDVVPIAAGDDVESVPGSELEPETVIGAAVQSRQFDSGDRYVNPLYVSPGHRVGWETAADLALATTAGYKLPEPTRTADREVGELAAEN